MGRMLYLRECDGKRGQEGLASVMRDLISRWDELYTECSGLLASNQSELEPWSKVFAASESLMSDTKENIDIVKTTSSALKRAEAKREAAKAKAK